MTTKLSEHFTLEEMVFSDTAVRLRIDNTPAPDQVEKLRWLAGQLELARALLGPLHVNSGFRCLALNRALKSDDKSQHRKCEAADLKSLVGLTPRQMCERVAASEIPFDQVIYEYSSWMHISFVSDRPPRRNVITINHDGLFDGLVEERRAA